MELIKHKMGAHNATFPVVTVSLIWMRNCKTPHFCRVPVRYLRGPKGMGVGQRGSVIARDKRVIGTGCQLNGYPQKLDLSL